MRRTLLILVLVGLLMMLALPAMAVIHVTVPADECSPSDNAVRNDTFESVILGLKLDGILTTPLGGAKTAATPDACLAS